MKTYEEKTAELKRQLAMYAQENVMVAFSGGVDSSLLLKLTCEAAVKAGTTVYAVTMQTTLHPVTEITHALSVAEEIGAKHITIPVDELAEAGIEENPTDRCYRCKQRLFQKMKERAEELFISCILEGTNEDDLHVYRPGLKALKELGIKSPLAEAGLTKTEVRRLAKAYGLSVSNRPAMPCLATRFPYGTKLSYEALFRVEKGETYLKELGVYNVRLRVHKNTVRIEVDEADFKKILENRAKITAYLKDLGYLYITLDLEGFRSGSMDAGMVLTSRQ